MLNQTWTELQNLWSPNPQSWHLICRSLHNAWKIVNTYNNCKEDQHELDKSHAKVTKYKATNLWSRGVVVMLAERNQNKGSLDTSCRTQSHIVIHCKEQTTSRRSPKYLVKFRNSRTISYKHIQEEGREITFDWRGTWNQQDNTLQIRCQTYFSFLPLKTNLYNNLLDYVRSMTNKLSTCSWILFSQTKL